MSLVLLRPGPSDGRLFDNALLRRGFGAAGAALGLAAAVQARRHRATNAAGAIDGPDTGVRASDGVALHVEEDGPADGPVTVLFVHGFAATLEEFDAQRAALRNRARLVLFDLRGHGRSGWGGYRRATIEQLGNDLGRVLDERGGTAPVVLVGHSLGGMAVLALAAQRPELFGGRVVGAGLVSTSASPVGISVVPRWVKRLLRRTGAAWVIAWALWSVAPVMDRLRPFDTDGGRRLLKRWLFGAGDPPPALVSRVQRDWVRTPHVVASAFYAALVYEQRGEAATALARVPVAVVTGSADTTIRPRHSHRLAALIGPAAHLVEVTGAGHMLNLTHPEALNRTLRSLVDSVDAGRRPDDDR